MFQLRLLCQFVVALYLGHIWAATWQNQQSECASSEDSDQPGHPPSLIRVFALRMKKAWDLSYPFSAKRRISSDWADAQTDLSLRWAHNHFVGFVMSRLIYIRCIAPALSDDHVLKVLIDRHQLQIYDFLEAKLSSSTLLLLLNASQVKIKYEFSKPFPVTVDIFSKTWSFMTFSQDPSVKNIKFWKQSQW